APTPASALMHAGFVNAGGILLTLFAPVFASSTSFMLLIVAVGGFSALLGKLLKSVQSNVKRKLGCSTVGQMGFMIMQAGLGFFSAAVAHLMLHGFYKAYLFLSSSGRVEQKAPQPKSQNPSPSTGVVGWILTVVTAIGGGAVFAILTGKGTSMDSGLVLTLLVVLTTLHATHELVLNAEIAPTVKPMVVLLVFVPAITVYSGVFIGVSALMKDLPMVTAPTEFTVVHGILGVVFTGAYIAIELELHHHSKRLYVTLLNLSQPSSDTVLTQKEEYNEY
ncbi:MAG: proton-conducting transporter membrane subunit, partial [Halobacteria archaeon]|nr:proton-conducting transporter membrane subunit [Halobacteria archaeon]